jgi:hypothetical protein
MQRIYATVIFIITITIAQAQAQINEVPLSTNPILKNQHAVKQQQIQSMLAQRKAELFPTSVQSRDVIIKNWFCLESQDTFITCIDTTNIGDSTSFELINLGDLAFGTVSLDSTCATYVADAGVDFGIDSLSIKVCNTNSGVCDTTIYPIYVHRPDNTITLPTTFLAAEDTITICVDTGVLPSPYSSATLMGNNPTFGDVYSFGSCIFYEANRFSGNDVVTFEICDAFCVCDTYKIPFLIIQDTIELPFMDDFSYAGPYPNNNWVDKNVFVNNTMAVNPVSVGIATFDGLNEMGGAYGGGYGSADYLTSAYLKMGAFNVNSNLFLSFYVEPKGLADVPGYRDSLVLEFKNAAGDWSTIDTFTTLNTPTTGGFTFHSYPVNENQYLYNGFQFRFTNYTLRSGNLDHWHLDYIRLAIGNGEPFLQDIAFTKVPNPILADYTSMPWWHFIADVDGEIPAEDMFIETGLYNHSDLINTTENTNNKLVELQTGTEVYNLGLLEGLDANIPPGSALFDFPIPIAATYPAFAASLNSDFGDDLKYLEFQKTYSYDVSEEAPSFNPTVADNNIVTYTTIFDNYFAYDDGTAESGLEATKKDVQIALKFHANVVDSLKGVQFHFPHIFANTSTQNFTLKVWIGQLDDTPDYEGFLQKPIYIDGYLDSLQAFTTYVLKDANTGELTPLEIPVGDFYVGWQQVSNCSLNECIVVGTDKSKTEGMENLYFDGFGFGIDWENVAEADPNLEGTLMIRPIVGAGTPEASSKTDKITRNTKLNIFPNPTTGFLNIEINDAGFSQFSYTLFDAVGKILGANQLINQINISHLQNGIYFIKVRNDKTNEMINRKIILVK